MRINYTKIQIQIHEQQDQRNQRKKPLCHKCNAQGNWKREWMSRNETTLDLEVTHRLSEIKQINENRTSRMRALKSDAASVVRHLLKN